MPCWLFLFWNDYHDKVRQAHNFTGFFSQYCVLQNFPLLFYCRRLAWAGVDNCSTAAASDIYIGYTAIAYFNFVARLLEKEALVNSVAETENTIKKRTRVRFILCF